MQSSSALQYITFRYCELAGAPGSLGNANSTGAAVYCVNPGDGSSHDITFQYCWTHDVWPDTYAFNASNITIEYCFMDQNASTPSFHGQNFNGNNVTSVIFRYNRIRNPQGTAVFTIPPVGAPIVANVWIYGNVIYDDGGGSDISAFVECINDATANSWRVFNNTLVGIQWWPRTTSIYAGSDDLAYNNLYVNCADVSSGNGGFTVDYSGYSGTPAPPQTHVPSVPANPFVNAAAFDFHLTAHTGSGFNAGAPFNIDVDGNTRTNWDVGAYEYVGGGVASTDTTAPTVALTAPAANAVLSNTVSLTATATDNVGGSGVANVTFLVDGSAVGSDSATPYAFSLNTATLANGAHTVQARATDVAGNQATTATVAVTVQNTVTATVAVVLIAHHIGRAGLHCMRAVASVAAIDKASMGVALSLPTMWRAIRQPPPPWPSRCRTPWLTPPRPPCL